MVMPHELRKIFFNAVDLAHAIEAYRNDKPQFLPQGKLQHVQVMADHLLVRVELSYVDNRHTLDYKIDYDKTLDAMVAFCLARRIPLPSAGIKRTYPVDDEVVLEVVLAEEAMFSASREGRDWSRLRTTGAMPN
jgi:hypothetical protein